MITRRLPGADREAGYRSTETDGRSIDTASAAIFEHLAKSKEIEQFFARAPHNRK